MDAILDDQMRNEPPEQQERIRQAVVLLDGTGFWIVPRPSPAATDALDDPAFMDWIQTIRREP
jgi:hypothetical protein